VANPRNDIRERHEAKPPRRVFYKLTIAVQPKLAGRLGAGYGHGMKLDYH